VDLHHTIVGEDSENKFSIHKCRPPITQVCEGAAFGLGVCLGIYMTRAWQSSSKLTSSPNTLSGALEVIGGELVFPMGDEDDFAFGGRWSTPDDDAEGSLLPSVMDWPDFFDASQGNNSSTNNHEHLTNMVTPESFQLVQQPSVSPFDDDGSIETSSLSTNTTLGSQDGLGHDMEFGPG
jgi:hypothetical protein